MQTINVQPWGEGQGDFVVINDEDFDPAFHVHLDGEDPAETFVADAIPGQGPLEQAEPVVDAIDGLAAPLVEIPAAWKALHWKQRVVLAQAINPAAGEIDAKAADAIVSAELLNRVVDEPQEAAGGLTIRELRADIAGLGLDVDPTMGPAELVALRDATRAAQAE